MTDNRNDADTPSSGAGQSKRSSGRHKRSRRRRPRAPKESQGAQRTGPVDAPRHSSKEERRPPTGPSRFAAIDLGTNNCRLLVATPKGRSFRVIDAFSRIVRLGEGLQTSGALSDAAMDRTVEALKICAEKIKKRNVNRMRCIATQACRGAVNGDEFLARVKSETGLDFDIITTEEEARLAVDGCVDLMAQDARGAIVFDIGGGSTEISVILRAENEAPQTQPSPQIDSDDDLSTETDVPADSGDGKPRSSSSRRLAPAAWLSMPLGVVSLSEKWGGGALKPDDYNRIVDDVRAEALARGGDAFWSMIDPADGHLIGTSGTVTSIAGIHLKLPRYRREAVDGYWLSADDVRAVSQRLLDMSLEERANEPCIGAERADLVVCGCAILEGILRLWPTQRIRVADRGLREGILAGLAHKERKRRRRRRRRNRGASSEIANG